MSNQPFRIPKEGLAIKNPVGNAETRIITGSTLPPAADFPVKTIFIHDTTGVIYSRQLGDEDVPVWVTEEISSGVIKGEWDVTPTVTPESIENTDVVDMNNQGEEMTAVYNESNTKVTITVNLSEVNQGTPEVPVIVPMYATFGDVITPQNITKRFSMKMLHNQESNGILILSGYVSTNVSSMEDFLTNIVKSAANLEYQLNFGTMLSCVGINGLYSNNYQYISSLLQHHNTNAVIAANLIQSNEFTFQVGETVVGANNGYQATVLYCVRDATYGIQYVELTQPTGEFEDTELLVGQISGAESHIVRSISGYYSEAGKNTISSGTIYSGSAPYQINDEFDSYIGFSDSPQIFDYPTSSITGVFNQDLEDILAGTQTLTALENNLELRFFTAVIYINTGDALPQTPIQYEINFAGARESFDVENTTWGTTGSFFLPQYSQRQEFFNELFPNMEPVGTDYIPKTIEQVNTFPEGAAVNEIYRIAVDEFDGEEYDVKPFKIFVKNQDIIQITSTAGEGNESFRTLTNYNQKDESIDQESNILSTLSSVNKSSIISLDGNSALNTSSDSIGFVTSTGSLRDDTGTLKFEIRKIQKASEYVVVVFAAIQDDYDPENLFQNGAVVPDTSAAMIQLLAEMNSNQIVIVIGSVDDAGNFVSHKRIETEFDIQPALSDSWMQIGFDKDNGIIRIIYRDLDDTATYQQIIMDSELASIKAIHPDDKWNVFFPIIQTEEIQVNFGETAFELDEIVQYDKLYVHEDATFTGTFFKTDEKWNPNLGLPQTYKVAGACVEVSRTGDYRGRRFIRGSLAYWDGYNTVPFTYITDELILKERLAEIDVDIGEPEDEIAEIKLDVDNVNKLNTISNLGTTVKRLNIQIDLNGVVNGDRVFIRINDANFDGVAILNPITFFGIGAVLDNERNSLDMLSVGMIRKNKIYEFIYQELDGESSKFVLMNNDNAKYGINSISGNYTLCNKDLTSVMTLVEGESNATITIPVRGNTFYHQKGDTIKLLNETVGGGFYGSSSVDIIGEDGVTIIYPYNNTDAKFSFVSKPSILTCLNTNVWFLENAEISG